MPLGYIIRLKMKALIIEDEHEQAASTSLGLKMLGYSSTMAADGASGLGMLLSQSYDLVIVDLKLPDMDGQDIIKAARAKHIDTTMIIISCFADEATKVSGLDAGADDYLTKPFSLNELRARIDVINRRKHPLGSVENPAILSAGDLSLNLITRKAARNGTEIELSTHEFKLLEILIRYRGQPLDRDLLEKHAWNYHLNPYSNLIDVNICRLRKKLSPNGEPPLIESRRNAGYVLT